MALATWHKQTKQKKQEQKQCQAAVSLALLCGPTPETLLSTSKPTTPYWTSWVIGPSYFEVSIFLF